MVVAVVITLPTTSFKSVADAHDFYVEKLEKGGTKKIRQFQVELVTYQPLTPNSKMVHLLSHSEYPASCFCVTESGHIIVADNTFVTLMNKLKTLKAYDTRLPKMDSKGTRFEYQDFVINIGTVSQAQNAKGLILEVGYLPTDESRDGYCLIQEFLQSFLSTSKQQIQKLLTDQLKQLLTNKERKDLFEYTPTVTMYQYLEILSGMRKQPSE